MQTAWPCLGSALQKGHEVGVGGNFYAMGSSCRVLEELDFGSVEVMTMKTLSVRGSAR